MVFNQYDVAVLMMTFNHQKYIVESINSVLSQKFSGSMALIIGDDYSTDRTQEMANSIIKKYNGPHHIIFHRNDQNIGFAKNFFTLYNNVSSKYVAICEGDDLWGDVNKVQIQFDFLEANKDFVISGHNFSKIDSNGKTIGQNCLPKQFQKNASEIEINRGFGIMNQTAMFRRIDTPLLFNQPYFKLTNGDRFIQAKLGSFGKYKYHDNILPTKYRIHIGVIWSKLNEQMQMLNHYLLYSALSKEFQCVNPTLKNYYILKSYKSLRRYFYLGGWQIYKPKDIIYLLRILRLYFIKRVLL